MVQIQQEQGANVAKTQPNSNKTTRYFERLTTEAGVAPGVAQAILEHIRKLALEDLRSKHMFHLRGIATFRYQLTTGRPARRKQLHGLIFKADVRAGLDGRVVGSHGDGPRRLVVHAHLTQSPPDLPSQSHCSPPRSTGSRRREPSLVHLDVAADVVAFAVQTPGACRTRVGGAAQPSRWCVELVNGRRRCRWLLKPPNTRMRCLSRVFAPAGMVCG